MLRFFIRFASLALFMGVGLSCLSGATLAQTTPAPTTPTTPPSAGAQAGSGTCRFTCQAQVTPISCLTDQDCAEPCQRTCGRSFRDGQCVTAGSGAARCAVVGVGTTKQCIFECSIGASQQERSCNPQGRDAQAPGTVCGSFCEESCRSASTQQPAPTGRFCGGSAPTCLVPGQQAPATTPTSRGNTQTNAAADSARLQNPIRGVDSIAGLVGRVIKGLLGIVGSAALLIFIYGGIQWILSSGDPKKVTAAQNILRNASIGLVLIFFSYTISSVVLGFLNDIGGGASESGSGTTSGGSSRLATCVEYAVTHGHIGRNEAQDLTSPDWACRQTAVAERTNRNACITRGCPGQSAEVLCCAPLGGQSPAGSAPAAPGAEAPVAPVAPAGGAVTRDTAGVQGACTCRPSIAAGLISSLASAEQVRQVRDACQAPPASGTFNESAFTCTGRSTERECQTVQTELNRYLTGLPVSAECTWTR